MCTDATNAAEADICYSLLTYLKTIKDKRILFNNLLFSIFGERLNDSSFLYWLGSHLNLDFRNLRHGIKSWSDSDFQDLRGRKFVSTEVRQQKAKKRR